MAHIENLMAQESSVKSSIFSVASDTNVVLQCERWTSKLAADSQHSTRPLILFVHQYTVMGGCRLLMAGLARLAADAGFEAVTFDLRGAGQSTGTCTFRNRSESRDVKAVIRYLEDESPRQLFLVGSSAGAALVGSVLDFSPRVVGGLFVGYTWGWRASLLFGWAFESIERSSKPKLFIVGTADEFTSMAQYQERLSRLAGRLNRLEVLPGLNHFQIEAPACDQFVVNKLLLFLDAVAAQEEQEKCCYESEAHASCAH